MTDCNNSSWPAEKQLQLNNMLSEIIQEEGNYDKAISDISSLGEVMKDIAETNIKLQERLDEVCCFITSRQRMTFQRKWDEEDKK